MSPSHGPFKGLASFEDSESDARFFFGRGREREIIVANLLASRLTVLYGDTGVGKSSVLRAGVARDLRALPDAPAVVVFGEWRDEPAQALEARISEATGAEPQGRIADTLEVGAAIVGGEVVVLLDGLEEEFLYHGAEAGPGSFLDEFSEAAMRPGLRASFLLAVREDALAKLDRFKSRIPNVFGNYLRLEQLDRAAARDAIVGPVARYNESAPGSAVEVEPALVDAVLDQVAAGKVELGTAGRGGVDENGSRGIEAPYLQLVMAKLWTAEEEAGSHVLRLETLTRLGGAEQIVRDHLEGALDSLASEQQDTAAAVFNHLVTPSGAKIAHDAADLGGYLGASADDVQPVLSELATQRILRPVPGVRGSDPPRYEIYHDVLAEAVLAWRTRHAAEREVRRVEAAGARRHRRLVILASAALLLVAAMAVVTIFAFTQRSEAQAQTRKAQARALDASALSELSIDPELSLLLSVEAAKRDAGQQSEEVLRQALAASRVRGIFHADGPVTAAEYSPDGRRILVASGGGEAAVYDARTRKALVILLRGAPIAAAGFSADGTSLVTGRADGKVQVWSAGGRLEHTLHLGAPVRSVAIDPSGRRLAAAGRRVVEVWDAGSGAVAWTARLAWPVTRAVFGPSGSLLGVIGNSRDALVYDAASGRVVHRLDQGDFVKSLAFSPNGAYLVTGGRNQTARLWSLETGGLVVELFGHAQDVVGLAFSPDGRTLATASTDGTARTWSIPSGAPKATFAGHTNAVVSVAFSPDGRYLLTASSDRTARLWRNAATPQVVGLFAGDSDAVTAASFSPDGRRVLTASNDGTARLWEPGQPTFGVVSRESSPVLDAEYVGRDEIAIAGSKLTMVRISSRRRIGGLSIGGGATAEAVRSDGKLIAVAFGRQVALVTPAMKARLAFRQAAAITGIAFSPDGSRIATAGTDGVGRIWTVGGRLLLELKGHYRALTGIAFSPDGTHVATSSRDATAKIWDARTGRLVRTLRGHTKSVTSVAFSPDGKSVVTASEDHDARVWSVATGATTQLLRWHFGTVSDAQFSPDGRWVVTVGPQTAQLWQPGVQDPFFQFGIGGPAKALTSAVFDSTSRVVLAASEDGTVRTYRCDLCGGLHDLLRLAQTRLALTGSTLSEADRKRFGG
ncbi:MAG TPA: hypothetical protein VLJ76_02740 [Gaiellaceae bacterium]|nr:hypothetical protein [Gaiellaceae bacterium]